MNAVDLFAGAGGWSHGWRMATGCEPMRDHHSVVAASLTAMRGTTDSHLHGDPVDAPLRTISAGGNHHALVAAFLTQYYSQGGTASRLDAPMPAVVTRAGGRTSGVSVVVPTALLSS